MSALPDNPSALRLLQTAERLFAIEGIDAVSTRRISVEAGQRNNSALQYHFGSKDALIEAILEYRMGALNQRRLELLGALDNKDGVRDVRVLIDVLARPLLELLRQPPEESYYISLLSQLHSQQRYELLFPADRSRTQGLLRTTALLGQALPGLSAAEQALRFGLMGLTLTHAVAAWDHQRRLQPQAWTGERLRRAEAGLLDCLVGMLTAPSSLREGCAEQTEDAI